jgi:hypothetical protein
MPLEGDRLLRFRSRSVVVLLSIMVPLSLFVSFRLTGVLHGPVAITETVTLNPAKWQIERPDGTGVGINEIVTANYENDVTFEPQIWVTKYWNYDPAVGSDFVEFMVNVSATVRTGFVYSANVTFWEDHDNSYLYLFPMVSSGVQNLSVASYEYLLRSSGLKAFITLAAVNEPKIVYFADWVHWFFFSPYNYTHSMEVDVDLVYYNGSVFNRVVQPFFLKIGPDNNNDFQDATEITLGNYTRMYIGFNDAVDYYKIQLDQGQRVSVYAYGTPKLTVNDSEAVFNLYVYDPEQKLFAEAIGPGPSGWYHTQELEFTSNSTGFWYIKIQDIPHSYGFYAMEVSG